MSKFYEVSKDTEKQFYDVFNQKAFPVAVGFKFIGSEKQKQLIKIKKISDEYSFLLEKELLIVINEDLLSVFDEESILILIEQEIEKITINNQTGKIKMSETKLNTFPSLVKKYGIDKVSRANQLETLTSEQIEDGKEEFSF